ncbi:fungal-specific transcription factor domain-containing protein [Dipodascopsis uninucleata]
MDINNIDNQAKELYVKSSNDSPAAVPVRYKLQRRIRVVSCMECHRRKQKCNRQWPCNQCTSRNVQSSCYFPNRTATTLIFTPENSTTSSEGNNKTTDSVGDQIDRVPLHVPAVSSTMALEQEDDVSRITTSSASSKSQPSDDLPIDTFGYLDNSLYSVIADITNLNLDDDELKLAKTPLVKYEKILARRDEVERMFSKLPAKQQVDVLVDTFFRYLQLYSVLHEGAFREKYNRWWNTEEKFSLEYLETGCIIFHMMALGILFLPKNREKLTVTIDGDFEILSDCYHDTAVKICDLFDVCYTTVLSSFLVATWYKLKFRTRDSWYEIAKTIRYAQEIHLHTEEPNEPPSYEREMRRRLWWTLYYWDRSMGATLSRPLMIIDEACTTPLPLDLSDECLYPTIRNSDTLVTKFTVRRIGMQVCKLLSHYGSERDPNKTYRSALQVADILPNYLRPWNRDTSRDHEYDYLQSISDDICILISLYIISSYRRGVAIENPYAFLMSILRACKRIFATVDPVEYRQFKHIYASLEPVVVLAGYLLNEFRSQVIITGSDFILEDGKSYFDTQDSGPITFKKCIKEVSVVLERFNEARVYSKMANFAYRVVYRIYDKLCREYDNRTIKGVMDIALPTSLPVPDAHESMLTFGPRVLHDLQGQQLPQQQGQQQQQQEKQSVMDFHPQFPNMLNYLEGMHYGSRTAPNLATVSDVTENSTESSSNTTYTSSDDSPEKMNEFSLYDFNFDDIPFTVDGQDNNALANPDPNSLNSLMGSDAMPLEWLFERQ